MLNGYQVLVDRCLEALILLDTEGRIAEWNPAAERMLGRSRSAVLERYLWDVGLELLPPDRRGSEAREVMRSYVVEAMSRAPGEETGPRRTILAGRDGARRMVETRFVALSGDAHRLACFVREVGPRTTEDGKLLDLLESTADMVGIADVQGRMTYLNAAARRFVTPRPARVPRLEHMLPPRAARAVREEVLPRVLAEGEISGSGRLPGPGNTPALEVEYRLFRLPPRDREESPEVAVVVRDISPLRAAERLREQDEEKVQQLRRLESVGRLAAGIAHDFNNILTAVIGYAELMQMEDGLSGSLQECITGIRRSAERAAFLTRQLLAFGRKQLLRPREADLNRLLESWKTQIEDWAGPDVLVTFRLDPHLGHVEVDEGQLQRVMESLVRNARDAMPEGGTLEIRTSNAVVDTLAKQDRYMAAMEPGSYALLTVSDTGHGMGEGISSVAFEPFFTTKDVGRASGLGLSMAYGIVKQSDGYIWAESYPGAGTTMLVYLPLMDQAVQTKTTAGMGPFGSELVLIVEREHVLRTMMARVLSNLGYRVGAARSLTEAERIVSESGERADLVLVEAGASARSADRLSPLDPLVLGRRALYTADYRMAGESPVRMLEKPFTPDQLARKVRDTLDEEVSGPETGSET